MIKVTLKRLNLFHFVGKKIVNGSKEKTRLIYAIEKILRKTKHHLEDLAEIEDDIKEKWALTGERGMLLRDDKGKFCYDKESFKKMRLEIKEAYSKEVEIEPHIVTEYDPNDLTHDTVDVFEGIVIPELKDE